MRVSNGNHLLRVLTTVFGLAVVVGGTIGQGIMRTPGIVAQGVPHAEIILLLWLVGGIASLIDAMSTVELAASIRLSGGPYAILQRAFGQTVGLAVGLGDWLGNVAAIGYIGVVFAEYLQRLDIASDVPIGVLAAALPLATGSIHFLGTRIGARSQEIGSAVKALIYLCLIAALIVFGNSGGATQSPPPALTAIGFVAAVRAIFGAYNGWNSVIYFSEEMKDARHSIARSIFVGILIITAIYMLMNFALLSALTPTQMAGDTLVAADAASHVFGFAPSSANLLITIISLISVVTIANVMMMQHPRVLFAIGRDRDITMLAQVAPNGTPRASLIVTAVLAALLATFGVYEALLSFSLVLATVIGIAMNVAAIALRLREPELERPYRMPLFPLPALLSMLVNTALLCALIWDMPSTAALALGSLLLLILILRPLIRHHAPPAVSA